jgi:hypothetical protein
MLLMNGFGVLWCGRLGCTIRNRRNFSRLASKAYPTYPHVAGETPAPQFLLGYSLGITFFAW